MISDETKSKDQLMAELAELRQRVQDLTSSKQELEQFATTSLSLLSTAMGSHLKIYGLIRTSEIGSVFLAQDLKKRRAVAVKILHSTSQEALRRFRAEAENTTLLQHPTIMDVLELGLTRYPWYYTMEYIPGKSLRVYLSRHGPVPSRTASQEIANQLLIALSYVHSNGLCHNNVKPETILVDYDETGKVLRIKLTHFGLADRIGQKRAHSYVESVGATVYQAPEFLQEEATWPASDFYSFGLVLGELLTGHVPLSSGQIEPPPNDDHEVEVTDDVPPQFVSLLKNLMSNNRHQRLSYRQQIEVEMATAFTRLIASEKHEHRQ